MKLVIKIFSLLLVYGVLPSVLSAKDPLVLFEFGKAKSEKMISLNAGSEQDVTLNVERNSIDVKIKASGSSSFPGFVLKPSRPWNLSDYGRVEASVTNTGSKLLYFNLRIDNEVKGPADTTNTGRAGIKPGETQMVTVYFGYSYGSPGYALNPKEVTQMLFFCGNSDVEQSFRVELVQAAGQPGEKRPEAPAAVPAVKP